MPGSNLQIAASKVINFAVAFITFFLFSGQATAQTPTAGNTAEAKFVKSIARTNMEKMAAAEKEFPRLNSNDIELAVFTASAYLNAKLSNLDAATGNRKLNPQERAYVMAIAVDRLRILAQIGNLESVSACHMQEAAGLFAMSEGKEATPTNCRLQVYSPEAQGRHLSETRNPDDSSIAELANRWAAASVMNGLYTGEIDHYGKTPNRLPTREAAPKRHCDREFAAIESHQTNQYELALLDAHIGILKWLIEYNNNSNVLPEDQLWSYKAYAISTYLLGQESSKSPRVQSLLMSFSDNASTFLRNKKTFEDYKKSASEISKNADIIRSSLMGRHPPMQVQTRKLSDCARAVGMMAAASRSR